jgi:hypothetical protein
MKPILESDKLSIAECRKILNVGGVKYSDEEIKQIREWIYYYAELTLELLDGKSPQDINLLETLLTQKVKSFGNEETKKLNS